MGAVVVTLALLGATATIARALPDEAEVWIRADTANFTLFSNVSRQHTLEVGRRLELFRHVVAGLNPDLDVSSPLPTYVFVFRNDRSFTPYKTQFGTGPTPQDAYFSADGSANFVALNAFPGGDPFSTVYHEFVHYFLNNNFSSIPLWFNEGLAEYYGTFRIDADDTERAEIGAPVDEYVEWLRHHSLIPLDDLFDITTTSHEYNEENKKGVFYAQSWALVHYLIRGEPGWGADLTERMTRLDDGTDDLAALARVPTYRRLEVELGAYVTDRRYRSSLVRFRSADVNLKAKIEPISRAETLYRLGNLLARIDAGKERDAERHFREAIRLDPKHAASHAGLGFLRDLQGRHEKATPHYENAFSFDPDDPMTCLMYATNLSQLTHGFSREAVPVPEQIDPRLVLARKLYRKGIRLQPDLAEAYAGLGATYVVEAGDLDDGILALETARRMLPSRMDVVFHLLQLHARRGDRHRAEALMEVLSRNAEQEMVQFGREALLLADLPAAEKLFQEDRFDEGMKVLLEIRKQTRDDGLKQQIDARIRELRARQEEIRRVEETNRVIGLYNDAVDRANRHDFRKAARILRQVIREAEDPGLISNAQDLLRRIDAASR